ncbi:3-deoxy-7-phosphoheptulonate synthase [Rhodococcus sp. NPDC059968]|uniref:3-deoxy-7-phosphoheptulonate synthase n=1 Tax=Rhodococcus sp. NPDC059968 TaxID=3347017 RepID=UPI00367311AC
MIIELIPSADETAADRLTDHLRSRGLHPWRGGEPSQLVLDPAPAPAVADELRALPEVADVIEIPGKLRRTSRAYRSDTSIVELGNGTRIGGTEFVIAAGPCAVETATQLGATASAVHAAGARILRGGAYKPRTSPFSFQGLGTEGLRLLEAARAQTGLPVVTEVIEPADVEAVAASADIAQVGARNMQNFALLKELGRTRVPVLLKRGIAATVDEWLLAAEYLLDGGNTSVILCERGIRSFDPSTRFTLDLSAIPVAKKLSHLPVIVDPSHAAGRVDLVAPLAKAAVGVGADGLIIDVHNDPATAACDAGQALTPDAFATLVSELRPILAAVGRTLATAAIDEPAALASAVGA